MCFTLCFRMVRWKRSAPLPPHPLLSPPPSPSPPVPSASVSPTPPVSRCPPLEHSEDQLEAFSVWGGDSPWLWSFTAIPLAPSPAHHLLLHPLLRPRCLPGSKVSLYKHFLNVLSGSTSFSGFTCCLNEKPQCSLLAFSSQCSSSSTSVWRRWYGGGRRGRGWGILSPDRK